MSDSQLQYEQARFADDLRTLGQQREQQMEDFLQALLKAAAPSFLESGKAIVVVGSEEVASVARLLLAQHGHATIEVQVAAAPPARPIYPALPFPAKEELVPFPTGNGRYARMFTQPHGPSPKTRKAARRRAKAGRKASR